MRTVTILTILILVLAFAGCHRYQQYDQRVQVDPAIRTDTVGSSIITRPIGKAVSALLGEGLEVTAIRTAMNKSDCMTVQVDGYNRAHKTKRFEYKFVWLDENDITLDTVTSNWQLGSAKGTSNFTIQGVSPITEAVDFRVDTRNEQK